MSTSKKLYGLFRAIQLDLHAGGTVTVLTAENLEFSWDIAAWAGANSLSLLFLTLENTSERMFFLGVAELV